MTTFVLTWRKTEATRRAEYVATGERAAIQELCIEDAALSPAGREALMAAMGTPWGGLDRADQIATGRAFEAETIPIALPDRDSPPCVVQVEAALAASVAWTAERLATEEAERLAAEAAHTAEIAAHTAGLEREIAEDRATHGSAFNDWRWAPGEVQCRAVAQERERKARAARVRPRRLAALLGEYGLADDRLSAHGTPERPLGLVSEGEAEEAIRDRVLPPIVGEHHIAEYERMNKSDVPHANDCEQDDCRVSFVAPVAETLTAAEYRMALATIEALRAGLPLVPEPNELRGREVWGQVYRHDGKRTCGGRVARLEVTVSADLGDGVVVQREYAIRDE